MSNHTPTDPPAIETINMTKSMIVREEVGNISEAIRLADELAGEAKIKRIHTPTSLQIKLSKE